MNFLKEIVFLIALIVNDSIIKIKTSFSIHKVQLLPEEQEELNDFFTSVIHKQAEKIILRKKK